MGQFSGCWLCTCSSDLGSIPLNSRQLEQTTFTVTYILNLIQLQGFCSSLNLLILILDHLQNHDHIIMGMFRLII